jgi:hypothetical protein
MAKLQIVHGVASALLARETRVVTWEALLKWVSSLKLESEVAEALCAIILARDSDVISLESLRRAIQRQSILSDTFISEAFRIPILYNSWAKAHSGEASPLYRAADIQNELVEGKVVPPILADRLIKLERTYGNHVLKQWVFEFDQLLYKQGSVSDGHWSYFISDDRERATGQFIGRRSHLARSAYLRTLALAFDVWGMPEEVVRSEAMYASPVDFAFLRMLPGEAPNWAIPFHEAQPLSREDWEGVLRALTQAISERDGARRLLHLNAPVQQSKRYQAEAEVVTVLYRGEKPSVEDIFRIHDWLPGHTYIARSAEHDFLIDGRDPQESIPLNHRTMVLPALLPAVAPFVGYVHSDLVGRMPYLPASYSSDISFIGRPCRHGVDFALDGKIVGEFRYWNWRWSPTHDKALGPNVAVSVTLSCEGVSQLIRGSEMEYMRVWRAKVLSRGNDYGKWEEVCHHGILPF